MTITLQAVNELIASLESAGELSIKETKVLELAKAFQQLTAENVSMDGFVEEMLAIAWQGGLADGSDIQELALKHGLIRQEVYCSDEHENCVYDPGNFEDGDAVYFRTETPATDRIVAGIKADEVEEEPFGFVSRSGDLVVIELNGDRHIRDGMPVFVKELREGGK